MAAGGMIHQGNPKFEIRMTKEYDWFRHSDFEFGFCLVSSRHAPRDEPMQNWGGYASPD
jgi:hypothetical protein